MTETKTATDLVEGDRVVMEGGDVRVVAKIGKGFVKYRDEATGKLAGRWHRLGSATSETYASLDEAARAAQRLRRNKYRASKDYVEEYEAAQEAGLRAAAAAATALFNEE